MAWRYVPAHVNETTEPVDNLGGILSVLLVAALVLAINFAPVPGKGTLAIGLGVDRARRDRRPSSSASAGRARRSTTSRSPPGAIFWVAACAGIIVFGSLMGAMFIGQQFLQNVLGYSTLDSGLAILPAAVLMVLVAPRSAKLVEARGARFTLLVGYVFCLLGFLTMLLLWKEGIAYWKVGARLRLHRDRRRLRRHPRLALADRLGPGHARRDGLGHRRPAARPRRRDHAVDLRRPAHRRLRRSRGSAAIASSRRIGQGHRNVQGELTKSFSSAADTAVAVSRSHPNRSSPPPRPRSCRATSGPTRAGIVAILLGAALVFFLLPEAGDEESACSRTTPPPTRPDSSVQGFGPLAAGGRTIDARKRHERRGRDPDQAAGRPVEVEGHE